MKKVLLFYSALFIYGFSYSQNIAIGGVTTNRALLEVIGVPGSGSTSAIFGGEGTGISVQRNWPGIGFNHYYDGNSKYIANGFAAVQHLDPSSGLMSIDMFANGLANTIASGQTTAITIRNDGNVGIKTNPGNATLYAIKGSSFDGSAVFGGSQYSSFFHYSAAEDTYIRGGKDGSNVYINSLPNGKILIGGATTNVGINSGNPQYSLEIRQAGFTGLLLVEPTQSYNNWEQVVGIYNSGPESSLKMLYNGVLKGSFRPTDGAYISSSDQRIKINIRSLPSLLDKILQLRPVEYEMKENNALHKKTIGFIAQEVNKIFPELITIMPNTMVGKEMMPELQTLNYSAFKIIAIKGVQEEENLLENLQNNESKMMRRLDAIEKKIKNNNQNNHH